MTAMQTAHSTLVPAQQTEKTIYAIVHGHFYQPPRENPYLNAIERQESAAPFHDWNQRIHHECYRPNAFARILNDAGNVVRIVNNFEYLSFNIGPTLLSWLEQYDRETYQRILDADRCSAARLNGHGNALAQVYNHIIMPLANWRDKLTQIRWGKADFRARFGREPEGMWLAETAVDYETLWALVSEGIKFTILAPSQAQRCRPLVYAGDNGSEPPYWLEVSGSQIDPTRPYRCFLKAQGQDLPTPDTPYIDIFFYDGPISRDMGFGELLSSSYNFATRLGQAIRGDRQGNQLIAVATDGETFGHHKHFTEKAIAYAFVEEFPKRGWQVTNFAHYLSFNPPTWEVELKPVTAWSCAHGVGRWQDDCGCGGEGGVWHQKWRRPLRDSLNWLRDRLADIYDDVGLHYFSDPWAARDAYIDVLRDSLRLGSLNHGEALEEFFARYGAQGQRLSLQSRIDALRLLEMQRHALLMFTSCGWFFEELSRPEGVQILRYAARAIELAADVAGVILEPEFTERLRACPSNVPEFGNGAAIYQKLVLPAKISLRQVIAHYAISSLYVNYGRSQQIYCYTLDRQDYHLQRMGSMALAIGHVVLTSGITRESLDCVFAILHLGGYEFHCCIQPFTGRREYEEIKAQLFNDLHAEGAAGVILRMSEVFNGERYSLRHLFAEERHRLQHLLVQDTLTRLDRLYEQVYRDNHGIILAFRRDGLPVPAELQVAAEIALNQRLLGELSSLEGGDRIPLAELDAVVREAQQIGCHLNLEAAARTLERVLLNLLWQVTYCDEDDRACTLDGLTQVETVLEVSQRLSIPVNLEKIQELYLHYLTDRAVVRYAQLLVLQDADSSELRSNLPAVTGDPLLHTELKRILHLSTMLGIDTQAWLPGV